MEDLHFRSRGSRYSGVCFGLSAFGLALELGALGDQLLGVVNALFAVLAILGVVNDPTTRGLSDSGQAMTYDSPKGKGE